MASFKKVAKGWQAQIAIKGHREARTLSTKAEAVAWAGERETELRRRAASGVVVDKTCGDAFAKYLKEVSVLKRGHRWEALRLNAIGEAVIDGIKIADIKLSSISSATLGAWRDQRIKGISGRDGVEWAIRPVAGATVNRDLNLLSHVFTTARREWKWIVSSPTTDVRRPKGAAARDRLPSQDEVDRICFALNFDGTPVRSKQQAAAVAYLFAMETAMRAGEICGLVPDWIVGSVAHLPASINKNGIKRDVALSNEARRLLSLLPASEGAPLFGISASSLDALFRKGRDAAGVEGTTFHDSRHAAITRLAKKLNVLELARMVGHRDLRQLQVYYNETAEEIAKKL